MSNAEVPTKAEQAMAAGKAIELYDAIVAMCGEKRACPEPFASLMSTLISARFDLERLAHV